MTHPMQPDITTQLDTLTRHLSRHPHLRHHGFYGIHERSNRRGGHHGLELRLGHVVEHGDLHGAVALAEWAATLDAYESHAYRHPGGLRGTITGHLGGLLLEIHADIPPDTPTRPGEHGYEAWAPEPAITLDEFHQRVNAGDWTTPTEPAAAPADVNLFWPAHDARQLPNTPVGPEEQR